MSRANQQDQYQGWLSLSFFRWVHQLSKYQMHSKLFHNAQPREQVNQGAERVNKWQPEVLINYIYTDSMHQWLSANIAALGSKTFYIFQRSSTVYHSKVVKNSKKTGFRDRLVQVIFQANIQTLSSYSSSLLMIFCFCLSYVIVIRISLDVSLGFRKLWRSLFTIFIYFKAQMIHKSIKKIMGR